MEADCMDAKIESDSKFREEATQRDWIQIFQAGNGNVCTYCKEDDSRGFFKQMHIIYFLKAKKPDRQHAALSAIGKYLKQKAVTLVCT